MTAASIDSLMVVLVVTMFFEVCTGSDKYQKVPISASLIGHKGEKNDEEG